MGKSNFGVLSSMRRGVFLFFSFLFCAFVTGCEEAEVVSSRRSVPKDGFVQTRTTEDGTTFAALVVAPRIPGYAPVSVTHLKKIDFLKDVKARGTDPGATGWFNNVFRVAENIYSLRVENVFQEDGYQFFGTAQMIRDEFVPDVFTSDDWVVFDCAVPQGSDALEVKFSNGTISAKVNIELQGNTATVSYNDGPFQPPLNLFGGGGDPRPLRIVLPVNNNPIFGGVSNEVLREYLGTWTVETTPALTDETFQLPATPFQFDLNAVIVDEITYQKKPNFVDTEGNEFYGGATFTAKAKVVGPGSDNPLRPDIPQNFACRAKVRGLDRTLGFDGVVHERILATGAVTRGGATLSFDWDGVGPGSVRYPAELDFGVSFWGLVTGSTPESVLNDQSATGDPAVGGSHSGPPGFFDEPNYNLEVSPNPFIPPEEEYIDLDGDGELDWNDYDQDGIPDGWPPEADTDGDGLPDVPPPDPFVTITAEPRKNGYDTKNWVIHVEDEEGNQIPDATFMGDTPTAYIEWTPPAELEPQILKVGIHAGLCRNRTLPLTVRAQDGGESEDGCLVVPEVFAELAYNLILELKEVQFGDTPLAERGDNGPYLVYDYINNEAPNEVAQWKKSDDKMVPVVMKMGSTVHAQARFLGTFSEGDSGVGVKVEEVRATIDLNGVSQIKLAELSQLNIPMVGNVTLATVPIELPNEIGRHKARITWDVQISDSAGSQSDSFVTPKDGSHMLYTVIGQQPTATQNTGSSPEESYLWYHPVHFRDAEVTSNATYDKPPTRSPLDMAVEWSKGEVGSESEVLARLASNIFEKSGYVYFGDTNKSIIRSSGIDFYYYDVLQEKNLECADASDILKIFANYLGLSARIRRFEADVSLNTPLADRDFLFTNYITLIGQEPDEPFSIEPPSYYLPLTITGTRRNFVQTYGTGNVKDSSGQIRSMDWVQYRFIMHQVVDLDGEVADCSARFEEVGPRDWYVNPDLIINQRSMPRPAAFAVTVKRLLPGYNLPQRIIDNSSPSFSENFTPVELKQEALTVDEYLDRFLYAWITPPSVRKPTGYNLEDFSSSSTLYDKLEFKR